jgi:hypothetical protein
MLQPDDIPKMEEALAERGIPVAELCRQAGIAETTWGRWKRDKFKPSFRAWNGATSAYQNLMQDAASSAA